MNVGNQHLYRYHHATLGRHCQYRLPGSYRCENDHAGTTDWLISGTPTSGQVTLAAGSKKTFRKTGGGGFWQPGDVYGYLQAAQENATFAQEED